MLPSLLNLKKVSFPFRGLAPEISTASFNVPSLETVILPGFRTLPKTKTFKNLLLRLERIAFEKIILFGLLDFFTLIISEL